MNPLYFDLYILNVGKIKLNFWGEMICPLPTLRNKDTENGKERQEDKTSRH